MIDRLIDSQQVPLHALTTETDVSRFVYSTAAQLFEIILFKLHDFNRSLSRNIARPGEVMGSFKQSFSKSINFNTVGSFFFTLCSN